MRILLIEDEERTVEELTGLLARGCGADVVVAHGLEEALDIISDREDFDLIVCDLRIPTRRGSLEVDENHGIRVHDQARSLWPGVPSIFFSGYANLQNIGNRLSTGLSADLFGTGEQWVLVDHFDKKDQPDFINRAISLADGINGLNDVELEGVEDLSMGEYEARPLRIYGRQLGGSRLRLSRLGGLSGAKVVQVEVLDPSSNVVGLVVAKVALVADVEDEMSRYDLHVAPVLDIGALAHRTGQVLAGAGRFGAVFYRLASSGSDLFDVIKESDEEAALVVEHLRDAFAVWQRAATRVPITVGELRSSRVDESKLDPFTSELDEIKWREVEALSIEMPQAVQHCDLHGKNVLIAEDGSPVVIDYGDVGLAPVVLDPITLELSLLLHEEHPDLEEWPSVEEGRQWFDLDAYTHGCPVPRFVRECRAWATEWCSETEIAAMVYAHAVRQLKYPDTDKALALAIAGAAASILNA